MSHGVWHASGSPAANLTKNLSVPGDSTDVRIVRGDKLTVQKDGAKVRIFVEYKDKHVVEGTVLKTAGRWTKGQYISVPRSAVLRTSEYRARITQSKLD